MVGLYGCSRLVRVLYSVVVVVLVQSTMYCIWWYTRGTREDAPAVFESRRQPHRASVLGLAVH